MYNLISSPTYEMGFPLNFGELAEAIGSDESRGAPLEPWIPCSFHEECEEWLVRPYHLEEVEDETKGVYLREARQESA